jgi:hypothetical protein
MELERTRLPVAPSPSIVTPLASLLAMMLPAPACVPPMDYPRRTPTDTS